MPLIKPRTRGKAFTRLSTRLEHETNETLYAYAQFLGEPIEYVLNQVIDTVRAKDKEFVTWRAEHPQSCVPRPRPQQVEGRRCVTQALSVHGYNAQTDGFDLDRRFSSASVGAGVSA